MVEYQENQLVLEERTAQARLETSFHYQMTNMKALKIVALIKFTKLNYSLDEVTDEEDRPYLLRTTQGELYDEYQIVSFIINDSAHTSHLQEGKGTNCQDGTNTKNEFQSNLLSASCVKNTFIQAKMTEQLFKLRCNLFPLLQELQKYLLGHEGVKKSKYEALNAKIRKEILNLDQAMGEHPEIFSSDDGFLNIIIACELFIGCKFAFQEKFRKSKSLLFNLCERISRRPEFEEVYGKAFFCEEEGLTIDFEEEDILDAKRAEQSVSHQIMNLMETTFNFSPGGSKKRNQLLYNFFQNMLKGNSSKISYFPYYWLMYDHLLCTLTDLHYSFPQSNQSSFGELERILNLLLSQLTKIIKKNVDYGFLGIYLIEKDRQYQLQGLICLGSMQIQELKNQISQNVQLRDLKITQSDVECEQTKRKIQELWEYQIEGSSFSGKKVSLLRGL